MTKDPSQRPDFRTPETLIPAIAQEVRTGEILMMAYMNEEAYDETLKRGQAVYYSRSRGRLWHKGEESGHVQLIKQICLDCDRDTILLKVEQQGPGACHEGYPTCFFREVTEEGGLRIIQEKAYDSEKTYGNS